MQERSEAAALHEVRDRQAGEVEERRSEVDVGRELLRRDPGPDPRTADEEWRAEPRLIHEPLVVESEVAEVPAVVRGVEDVGVGGEAGPVEIVEDLADAVVEPLDAGEVVPHVPLVLPADELLAGERLAVDDDFHRLDVEPHVPLLGRLEIGRRLELEVPPRQVAGHGLLVLRQRGGAGRVVVPEGLGLGDDLVLEQGLVPFIGLPGAVGGFLVEHEEERLVLGPRLQELDPEVRGDGGAVPFDREPVPRDEELRIPVGSLARQDDPAVEAGRVGAEVPLADHPGVISRRLKVFGDVVAGAVEPVEDRHAVLVRILAGQEGGAAGGADGVGDEGVGEAGSFVGQAVEVWRLVDLGAVGRDGVLRVVVGEEEEDVRAGRRVGAVGGERTERDQGPGAL